MKTPEQKAAELSASKDWPDKADPVLGKMHSIGWMAHREGFLAGVEWMKKAMDHSDCKETHRREGEDYCISLLENNGGQSENKEVLSRAATWLKRVLR